MSNPDVPEVASPQIENGYTKIANELYDALCDIRIPGEARQVLDVIIRKTYGWNKKKDRISLSQFVKLTGINKPCVVRAINKLLNMNLIVIEKDNGVIEKDNDCTTSYCIQKNYKLWKPLSKKITLSKKIISVIKKDNASLSKKIHTKDTTTKDTSTKDTISNILVRNFDSDDLRIARCLDELMQENNPKGKKRTGKQIEDWANTVRLMRKRDNRTHGEVETIVKWSQNDEFWKGNILSMGKLREQYDQLFLKMKTNSNLKPKGEDHAEEWNSNIDKRKFPVDIE